MSRLRRARGRDRALSDGAAALSTLGIGLASLDSDLRYLEVNDWLASAQGLSASEHRGRLLSETVPHLAGELEPVLRRVLTTGLAAIDVPIRESGLGVQSARHWLVRCYPVREEDRWDSRCELRHGGDHRPGPGPGGPRGQ